MHDMGIYQAGARLVQAILPFAMILSTVYMPTLSAAAIQGDDERFCRNSRRINLEFAALAVIGGLGFAFVGPLVTHIIYGPSYAPLSPLWTGFAIFVALRLMASSFGIQLSAIGFVRVRIAASVVSIGIFCAATPLLVPHYGLAATSWMLALSGLPSFLILGGRLARDRRSAASVLTTGLAVGLLVVALAAL
jgi:O-antigen/teichoic acid export membrane protein